jgi:hypothetical protein
MAKTIAISQVGGVIAGGGLPAAPGAPASIAVTGFIDPVSNTFTLSVNVTPPATLGTFIGCDLFLEIPEPIFWHAIRDRHQHDRRRFSNDRRVVLSASREVPLL